MNKETKVFEVGIKCNNSLHISIVYANKWEIIEDRLTFSLGENVAVFTEWLYVKRIEENSMFSPILISKDFVSTSIQKVKEVSLIH